MEKRKYNSVIVIPAKNKLGFYKYWLDFLKPFHHLTDKEMLLTAVFLKKRAELGNNIPDESLLDKVLMYEETKREIRDECGITLSHFQVLMGSLRKKNIIIENRINPKFIPKITEEGEYKLLLMFKYNDTETDSKGDRE